MCESTYIVVFRIIEKKICTCGCTERTIWGCVSSAYLIVIHSYSNFNLWCYHQMQWNFRQNGFLDIYESHLNVMPNCITDEWFVKGTIHYYCLLLFVCYYVKLWLSESSHKVRASLFRYLENWFKRSRKCGINNTQECVPM